MNAKHAFGRILVFLLVVMALFPAGTAHSAFLLDVIQPGPVLTVNDTADPGGPACEITACSLRAAVAAANAGIMDGGYIITFDFETYPAEIVLESPLPDITGWMQIVGPGRSALTISGKGTPPGGDTARLFRVTEDGTLGLYGLTLTKGWDGVEGGGAIRNGGSLYLTNVILFDNLAGGGEGGGLLNDATGVAEIMHSEFTDNSGFHDGAISNKGSITIHGSVFTDNRARSAGAIANHSGASMVITGSAFRGNIAPIAGGGAISNGGELVVANSTFYQNGGERGADILGGTNLHVTNSTFFGAIQPSTSSIGSGGAGVVFKNNIFAAAEGVPNCVLDPASGVVMDATNLSTDDSCAGATVVTLEALNFGPLALLSRIPALPPLEGSAAIGAGDAAVCAAAVGAPGYGAGGVDQRGASRLIGSDCDAGAIEYVDMRMLFISYIVR